MLQDILIGALSYRDFFDQLQDIAVIVLLPNIHLIGEIKNYYFIIHSLFSPEEVWIFESRQNDELISKIVDYCVNKKGK